jgi:hypothetical protein
VPTAVVADENRVSVVAEEDRSTLIPPEVRTETVQDVRTAVVV